jgi:hypothetical protein
VIAPRGYYLLHPIDILQFWEGGLASHGGAFYEKLLARGKKPIVATVAVMRKLLHSIYGMLKHGQDFHGEKFYHIPENVPMAA